MSTFWWRSGCWIIIFGLFWTGGCSQKQTAPPVAPPPAPPAYFYHTVRWPGETLIRIAWWYTGSGDSWQAIAAANPSLEPLRMQIGDSIQIPAMLMKTRDPMPKSYRVPVAKKRQPQSEPVETSLPRDEEIELFGPVDSEARHNRLQEVFIPAELKTGSHHWPIEVPENPQRSPDEGHDDHDGADQGQEFPAQGR